MSAFRSRSPQTGRILRPEDTFVLRPDLVMPGAYPLAEAVREVQAEWHHQHEAGHITEGTVATHSKVLNTLLKFASRRGVTLVYDINNELLNEWMFAANAYSGSQVAATTPGLRKGVASAFYITCFRLGITDVNLAATLPTAAKPDRYVNAFQETNIDRLKEASLFAFRETKSPSALALLLLGCSPGEVGCIRCSDVHLEDMLVRAHGGGGRYRERWLPIDDPWCFEQLAARVAYLARTHHSDWQDRYLAYEPRGGNDNDFLLRSAATSMTIGKVIDKAGLKEAGVRRVASIVEYVARRVFDETGSVEAVATRLGISKLDTAARIVGYDWRSKYTQPGPKGPGDGGAA